MKAEGERRINIAEGRAEGHRRIVPGAVTGDGDAGKCPACPSDVRNPDQVGLPSIAETEAAAEWLAGYRWALEHLTDPGVLRDAAQYADERGGHLTVTPDHVARSVAEPEDGCLPGSPRTGPREAGH